VAIADFVRTAQVLGEQDAVRLQLQKHPGRRKLFVVVVLEPLVPRDVADGTEGRAAQFAGAFRESVCHCEDLIGMFVQQQMEIAKIAARDVPMEVLGFDEQSERVSE
jgi:hypothetical protein